MKQITIVIINVIIAILLILSWIQDNKQYMKKINGQMVKVHNYSNKETIYCALVIMLIISSILILFA